MFEVTKTLIFAGMAAALLGSPGPGIAALIASGRQQGLVKSLPFFAAMQGGLLAALIVCAVGLSQLILIIPRGAVFFDVLAAAYLVYLGIKIATAPVRAEAADGPRDFAPLGGFLLGAANPKAYLALVALLSSAAVAGALGSEADMLVKVGVCLGVTFMVDGAWLVLGVGLRLLSIGPKRERQLNIVFGVLLGVTAALTFL